MPQLTTKRTTANAASTLVKVALDELIELLPVDDVPLQNYLGSEPVGNIKNEWLNRELDLQTATVNAISALASPTIVLVDSSGVRVGDVLKLKSATPDGTTLLVKVTANVYGTNTLTVTRPFAGSTDVALAVNDVLEIIGQDTNEGQDPPDPRDTDPTRDFNLTQIFQEQVAATRTAQKNDQYAVADPMSDAEQRKFKELNIRYERTLIHGRRNQSADTRQMGGMFFYVTSNLVSNTVANFETALGDMMEAAFNVGATPRTLIVSPAMKRKFSGLWVDKMGLQSTDYPVGSVKSIYHSDFGDVEVIQDRYVPRRKGFLIQTEFVKRQVFDNWFSEELAKTGDSDKKEIIAELSLKVKNPKAHGILTLTDL